MVVYFPIRNQTADLFNTKYECEPPHRTFHEILYHSLLLGYLLLIASNVIEI
jgi:hypothetical protein